MTDQGSPTATITSQNRTVGTGPNGTVTQGYRVEFKTNKGVIGDVFVALSAFTPDVVVQRVREEAMKLDALQGMTIYPT